MKVSTTSPDDSRTSFTLADAGATLSLAGHPSPQQTLQDHAPALLAHLRATVKEFALVSQRFVPIGAEVAGELVFDWTKAGVFHRNTLRFVVHAGTLWALTASAPRRADERTATAIVDAMNSFALVRRAPA